MTGMHHDFTRPPDVIEQMCRVIAEVLLADAALTVRSAVPPAAAGLAAFFLEELDRNPQLERDVWWHVDQLHAQRGMR